jgi:hypothetical protein
MRCFGFSKILILCLALSAFAFAGGGKSFYFNGTVSGAYSSFLTKYEYMDYKLETLKQRSHYYGFGPALDLKVGFNINGLVPLLNLQLMHSSGTIEAYNTKNDASANRFMLGAGINYFPFKNPESAMHGAYVGLSLGIMGVFIDHPNYFISNVGLDEQGFSASLELGKLWKLNEKWNVGVSGVATADSPIRFGEDTPDHSFYTLWLGVTVARM